MSEYKVAGSQVRITGGLASVGIGLLVGIAAVVCFAGAAVNRSSAEGNATGSSYSLEAPQLQTFRSLYEPSGVLQLPDGRILIAEDEEAFPFSIMNFDDEGGVLTEPLRTASPLNVLFGQPKSPALQDLEGVTVDSQGYVYAITSHSRRENGGRGKKRERLVRFRVDGGRMTEVRVLKKLRRSMIDVDPALDDAKTIREVKDENGLNIEGLSFDGPKQRLLIAFRSPVVREQAMIVVLNNPASVFDEGVSPNFEGKAIFLDLDKGGIRAIAFVPKLDGYLIVSRREDKKDKAFKLWLWDGNRESAPRRVRLPRGLKIPNAEGIAPVNINGEERLLMVFDDGNRKMHQAAHFLILSYDQLEIAPSKEMEAKSD